MRAPNKNCGKLKRFVGFREIRYNGSTCLPGRTGVQVVVTDSLHCLTARTKQGVEAWSALQLENVFLSTCRICIAGFHCYRKQERRMALVCFVLSPCRGTDSMLRLLFVIVLASGALSRSRLRSGESDYNACQKNIHLEWPAVFVMMLKK